MNYFIGDNFSHHAAHSGYMRLVSYIAGEKIFESEKPPLFSTLIKRLFVRRSGMLWYDAQSFVLELTAALKGVEKKHKIFHFLYGEDNYRYLGSIPWMKDNFIVATFHTPPAKFQRGMRYTNHLKNLRAAIIVSNYQRKILESVVSPERIHFIPHGIDTDFFRPAVKTSKICEWEICLCVGHHMRDLPTLCEAARLVSGKRPKVKFILVDSAFFTASFFSLDNAKTEDIRRSYLRQFEEIANFEFKSEIDEASLLDLYQKSDLLVLPLYDATANNSLLEAMACGLPAVVSDVGGIRDYVDESCAILVPPQDASKMAERILGILEERKKLDRLGQESRRRALSFSWPLIAKQVNQVYESILAKNGS